MPARCLYSRAWMPREDGTMLAIGVLLVAVRSLMRSLSTGLRTWVAALSGSTMSTRLMRRPARLMALISIRANLRGSMPSRFWPSCRPLSR
ncbi:hypothetical protein D3C85_1783870 [compost metagenome]